jgi:hypothetical protein
MNAKATKTPRQRLGYYKNLGQPNPEQDTKKGIYLIPQGVHTLMARFEPYRGKFFLEIPHTAWDGCFSNHSYSNGLRKLSPHQSKVGSAAYTQDCDIFSLPPQALVVFLMSKAVGLDIVTFGSGNLTSVTTTKLEVCFQHVQRVMLRVDSHLNNAKRIRFVDLVKYPDFWDAFIAYCHMCVTSMSVQWNDEENESE